MNSTSPRKAKEHVAFHHSGADGWVTIAKKDPNSRRFRQYHYQPEELAQHISEWIGEDVYFSQNTFYKPQRRIENIRQLRCLYVDLDVYNKGLTPEWVLGKLELEYFGQVIPEPNMVIFSGRGLVPIWNIEPIPYMAMPLWKAVEAHFIKVLNDFGADTKASDPTRIFRLAGTINSKSGTTVEAEYRHQYRYDIHQLQYDYLPELTPKKEDKPKTGRKQRVVRMFNIYTLHLARAKDIAKLVEIRKGRVDSFRELICFLYRYFTCCYTSDPEQALEQTISLNREFAHPLKEKEVINATKSAQRAWEAKSDKKADEAAKAMGFPGAGYRMKNTKIIEWLDITPEEQREMSTIIGPQEKRRRNTEKKREARRESGVKSRDEYLEAQKRETEEKVEKLKELMKNPQRTNKELAKEMGVSKSTIMRLKARLQ